MKVSATGTHLANAVVFNTPSNSWQDHVCQLVLANSAHICEEAGKGGAPKLPPISTLPTQKGKLYVLFTDIKSGYTPSFWGDPTHWRRALVC